MTTQFFFHATHGKTYSHYVIELIGMKSWSTDDTTFWSITGMVTVDITNTKYVSTCTDVLGGQVVKD